MKNVPGVATWRTNVRVPENGDAPSEVVLSAAGRDLADRTAYLRQHVMTPHTFVVTAIGTSQFAFVGTPPPLARCDVLVVSGGVNGGLAASAAGPGGDGGPGGVILQGTIVIPTNTPLFAIVEGRGQYSWLGRTSAAEVDALVIAKPGESVTADLGSALGGEGASGGTLAGAGKSTGFGAGGSGMNGLPGAGFGAGGPGQAAPGPGGTETTRSGGGGGGGFVLAGYTPAQPASASGVVGRSAASGVVMFTVWLPPGASLQAV